MKFNVDDLVAKNLVTKKTYTEGPFAGLSVLKYKNNVFWDNLWHTDERLRECRGMVVDSEDNVVIWPFTKIFNRFENGTDLPLDQSVEVVRKVNGFMASVGARDGKLIVSTTGTLDSEFAKMAEDILIDHCTDMGGLVKWISDAQATFVFEICDQSDPHIVQEKSGAYLIGIRIHRSDITYMVPEGGLDAFAKQYGFLRPEVYRYTKTGNDTSRMIQFGDVVEMAKNCQHEGFVVRSIEAPYSLLLKIKSPHYLAKKFLMRGSQNKWDMIWDNPQNAKQRIDEEFYELLDWLRWAYEKEEWAAKDSQYRRMIIEKYFEDRK